MFVGLLKLELYLPACRSLKEKRRIVKSIVDKLKSKNMNLSISEIGSLDKWKKSELAIVVVSNETMFIRSVLDKTIHFLNENGSYQVLSTSVEVVKF